MPDEAQNKYQIFQTYRRTRPGDPKPSWDADYRHVGNLPARNIEHAFHLAHGPETNWMDNPGVEVIKPSRPIAIGDVIIDPDGRVNRVEKDGYSQIASVKIEKTPERQGDKTWFDSGEPIMTRPEMDRISVEMRDEVVLARLHYGGVKYQDEPNRPLDGPEAYARSQPKADKTLER